MHPLRAWRTENHVTLARLANVVGVSIAHLSEIERGNNSPSLELADRLSRATNGKIEISCFVKKAASP